MTANGHKTVSFQTVGCRLNQYETERMAARLAPYGFRRCPGREPADLYVINTCTVTHRADSDSRYLVRRALRDNPNGRIVVVGCYVDHDPERVAGLEGVDVIIHNRDKDNIDRILAPRLPDLFSQEPDKSCSTALTEFHERNRAWVKVSDGCKQECSFCIVTRVRGDLVNLPSQAIIDEINGLVAVGYREVVLTGVNIGYYRDPDPACSVRSLADLCRKIMDETQLYRIRISSIEPQSVSRKLVRTYAEADGRICRHFHLPLQSGSTRILQLMRRPYDQQTYLIKAAALKEAVPETIIGADVIAGFPGETETDFKKTQRVCDSGLLDYLHVFSYSDRPGTCAATMDGKIDPDTIRQRNRALTRISHQRRYRSHQRHVGAVLEVIAEHNREPDGNYWAISDNYLRVKLAADAARGREIVRFRVTGAHDDHLTGHAIM